VRKSRVKRYTKRWSRLEHAEEIKRADRLRDYASAEVELAARVDVLGWAAGDGPEVIFAGAVTWLRGRGCCCPGVTTLARLVVRVRALVLPVAGSVPESVVNASSLVFQGWAGDRD
jgi:uncharacterized protein DUF4158